MITTLNKTSIWLLLTFLLVPAAVLAKDTANTEVDQKLEAHVDKASRRVSTFPD